MSEQLPRVALLLETSREFGRQLLRGIAAYSHEHGPWTFLLTPGDFRQAVPRMLDWGGDAIIARLADRKIAEALAEVDLPTVVIGLNDWASSDVATPKRLGRIEVDTDLVAKLAAEHLLDNRLKRFAFVGLPDAGFSEMRCRAFCTFIREAGHEVTVYEPPTSQRARLWENEHGEMARWISQLPKPIGIMAANDDRGREVLEACSLAGVKVPEDVSVIGVDNDSLICDLATPPLSSVEFRAEAGGYRAAALLHRMMEERSEEKQSVMVLPSHVEHRRSTSALAVEDRHVAAALCQIRRTRGRGVTVEAILAQTALPRRTLEVRFRKETGRSIQQEIKEARLAYAKELLAATPHPIARVAAMAGFSSSSYLSQVFRSAFECTPADYRKALRGSEMDGDRQTREPQSRIDYPGDDR